MEKLLFIVLHSPVGLLFIFTFAVFLWDHLAHQPPEKIKKLLTTDGALTYEDLGKAFKELGCVGSDNLLAVCLFLGNYCVIITSVILFNNIGSLLLKVFLIIFVAGRLRCLQEIGHYAMHGSLCPSRAFGYFITNIFFQYPCFKPDARSRKISHVNIHHPNANVLGKDPNLDDFIVVGLKPKIPFWMFCYGVIYPLTPRGILSRTREIFNNHILSSQGFPDVITRNLIVFSIVLVFFIFNLWREFLYLYIFPNLIVYPFFAWISQLVEHRWYAPVEGKNWWEKECSKGRATNYNGLFGLLIRQNILPYGDSYHLAHSLYPKVRWNYLPLVDKILKKHISTYSKNESTNLIFHSQLTPSALSELAQRLIN